MANFSGAIQISDLNDFITPSQDCIKPLVLEPNEAVGQKSKPGIIQVEDDLQLPPRNVGAFKPTKPEPVQITLNDCLACSGCITTAETILVSQQSQDELYKVLRLNSTVDEVSKKVIVISISNPSLASIAAHFSRSMEHTHARLTRFFKSIGVNYVFGMAFANDLAIVQSCHEFVQRYESCRDKSCLPMLAAQCPGWVCYAEKTHGNYILPHLSKVKSPQQILGTLVKEHFANRIGRSPAQIFHVTVMSCYDKKLEASRPDFYNNEYETRDVDCVLTTGEILDMITKENFNFDTTSETYTSDGNDTPIGDSVMDQVIQEMQVLYKQDGGASGGYLHHITKYAAKHLFDLEVNALCYKTLRNQDMKEITIKKNNEVVLRMAAAYGFRNIQLIVQKIKRGTCPYDYVEIMACPSGCNNGGGQILTDDTGEAQKDRLSRVEQLFDSLRTRDPLNNSVTETFTALFGGKDTQLAASVLETEFHAVQKSPGLLTIAW